MNKKIALVHDWLTGMRGGEKVLEVFCELFPQATIFTLLHVKNSVSPIIENMKIETSFVQKLPFVKTRYRHYLPLFPTAIEQFDLRDYDFILSTSHCVAKGVIPHANAYHVSYCHTPMRYVWAMYHEYFGPGRAGRMSRFFVPFFANYLRMWDLASNVRVNDFIANSQHVRNRIRRYYHRDATVIYPPLNTKNTSLSTTDDGYFLMVTAFAPYKRVDMAIQAFNELQQKLIIIGTGQDEKRLKALANSNIQFLGWVSDHQLAQYYANCRALIFPGEEDFGLVPVEAQCYGKPVIAYGVGGVLESVKGCWLHEQEQGKNQKYSGIFFPHQRVDQLVSAIARFEKMKFDPQWIRNHALQFDRELFKNRIKAFLNENPVTRSLVY